MVCLWSGTVADFKRICGEGDVSDRLARRYFSLYGVPSGGQIRAWKASYEAFADDLAAPQFNNLQAVLEMQIPIGGESADVILLGGHERDLRGYVLELKQWSEASVDPAMGDVVVPRLGYRQHPSLQVLNYAGRLHCYHSRASQYNLKAGVYLHNMVSSSKLHLAKGVSPDLLKKAPLFGKEDGEQLARSIENHLLIDGVPKDEHSRFCEAPFSETHHLFDIIAEFGREMASNAQAALAEAGAGLTEEQELWVNEVLLAVHENKTASYIINGAPGSGKTLVAVTLLLRALSQRFKTVLALRNNRLHAILEDCLNRAYPGSASGSLVFFEPRRGKGIGQDDFPNDFDLVIVDEAQRMEAKIMHTALSRGRVNAILLDEGQRLNPPEKGTVTAFVKESSELGKTTSEKVLKKNARCRGGDAYLEWVEALLQHPGQTRELGLSSMRWIKDYGFHFCRSIHEMLGELGQLRGSGLQTKVALVASFTESPGHEGLVEHQDNTRVGWPLTSGWSYYMNSGITIRWLMRGAEYVRFWAKSQSNNLDRCASIYGSQGFESDYVGIIWGRDFILRNGEWILGEPRFCYDQTDRLVIRKGGIRWDMDALDLVRNRYRIFLTRGIKGTFVFCEDGETREYLAALNANSEHQS